VARDVPEKHILDTSAWNALFDDAEREGIIDILRTKTILPTRVAISEVAAIEERRLALLRLVKALGRDNRPLATPNQLIILGCQGYARRAHLLDFGMQLSGLLLAAGAQMLQYSEVPRHPFH
jgi:hypothetical protein